MTALGRELRLLWDRAEEKVPGLQQTQAIAKANGRLTGARKLGKTTVNEWLRNDRVPRDFPQMWELVRVLLQMAEVPPPGKEEELGGQPRRSSGVSFGKRPTGTDRPGSPPCRACLPSPRGS
ncbi:hypothetical protein SMD20_24140 [Nonomuraea sp. LP-02]|uniref:hypothetical protein n=1 Tax=Nonomuraea sp. LP-02 TaxID=3097960 RepID=UPI002E30CAF8|nr:hypothetical protein [Nonomuraea sp. LP-02]MED7927370.1 hypothetical protein [Nonomuraea sp. LP-02]